MGLQAKFLVAAKSHEHPYGSFQRQGLLCRSQIPTNWTPDVYGNSHADATHGGTAAIASESVRASWVAEDFLGRGLSDDLTAWSYYATLTQGMSHGQHVSQGDY